MGVSRTVRVSSLLPTVVPLRRGAQVMSETRAIVPVPEEADAIPYWALAAARNELYAREYGYDFRMCARADCAPRALPYASNASNSSPCVRSV